MKNFLLLNSLKKISKIFTVNFIEKNFEFFSENPKKSVLPQKKRGHRGRGENPDNFSSKIRHDLSLGFDIMLYTGINKPHNIVVLRQSREIRRGIYPTKSSIKFPPPTHRRFVCVWGGGENFFDNNFLCVLSMDLKICFFDGKPKNEKKNFGFEISKYCEIKKKLS